MIPRRPGYSRSRPVAPGSLRSLILLLTVLALAGSAPRAPAGELSARQVQVSRCDTLELAGRPRQAALSSRFVIPSSLQLFCDTTLLSPGLYSLDPVRGLVCLDSSLSCTRLVASYLAWPFTFPDSFRLRASFADSLPAAPPAAERAGPAADSLERKEAAFGSGRPGE
ncbi:MAG: hypothetical protein JXQ83_03725, partial [Candidatus Glassbacteria bacterium]|nr:hypothetical protein [Candidatus Glassbacteria bacterium]